MRLKKLASRAAGRAKHLLGSWQSNLGLGLVLILSNFLNIQHDEDDVAAVPSEDENKELTLDVSAAMGTVLPDPVDEFSESGADVIVVDSPDQPPQYLLEPVFDSSDSHFDLELEGFDLENDILGDATLSGERVFSVEDYQVYTLEYVEPPEERCMSAGEDDDDDEGAFWLDPAFLLAGGLAVFGGSLLPGDREPDVAPEEETENQAPIVDLNADGPGLDTTATFIEVEGADDGTASVSFSAFGTNLSDLDNSELESLSVSISASSVEDGDRLVLGETLIDLDDTVGSGTVMYGDTFFTYGVEEVDGIRSVIFTGGSDGGAPIGDYELLLDALQFNNISDTFTEGGTRVFSVAASDGTDESAAATFTVTMEGAVDPADITVDMSAGLFVNNGNLIVDAYSTEGVLLFTIASDGLGGYEITDEGMATAVLVDEGTIIAEKTIAGTTLDAVVQFETQLFDYFGDVIFRVREGATYVDEASGKKTVLDMDLRAAVTVPEGESRELSITPFTESAIQLIEKASGDSFSFDDSADADALTLLTTIAANYAVAADAVSALVGIDIVTTRAVPVNDEERFKDVEAVEESNQYGLKLAALSELAVNELDEKVSYGVDALIGDLEVTLTDSGLIFNDLILFTAAQVELTDAFTSFNEQSAIVSLEGDEKIVAADVLVRDAIAPEAATIDSGSQEAGAFFIEGSADLIDTLNSAGTDEYLEFKLIFDNSIYVATYNEDDKSYMTSDPSLVISSFDALTGEAEWRFAVDRVLAEDEYTAMVVVTDGAENASALIKTIPVIDNPPELVIEIDQPLLMDIPILVSGETTEVLFQFSEEVVGFALEDIALELGTITDLVPDPDDPTLYTAQLTVSSDVSQFPLLLTVADGAVTDLSLQPNTEASHSYGVYAGSRISSSEGIIDDFLHPDDTMDVADGYEQENLLVQGDESANLLDGYEGDDILYGEGGDDILFGHEQDDVLLGGDGNDILLGGDGDDIANGGSGDDFYYADALGDYLDTENMMVGGEGEDTAVFQSSIDEYSVWFASLEEITFLNLLLDDAEGFRGITAYDLSFDEALPVLRVEREVVIENVFLDPQIDYDHQVDYVQVERVVFADFTLQVAGGENDTLVGGDGADILIAKNAEAEVEVFDVSLEGEEGADTFGVLLQDPGQGMQVTIEDFSMSEGDIIDIRGFYDPSTSEELSGADLADLVGQLPGDDSGILYREIDLSGYVDYTGEEVDDVTIRIEFDNPSDVFEDPSADWFAESDAGVLSGHWWDDLSVSLAG